jgi:alpha-galactosidase/6-phospho-beta-glucosidase family protein
MVLAYPHHGASQPDARSHGSHPGRALPRGSGPGWPGGLPPATAGIRGYRATVSSPRITIVGGGSTHWTPTLLVDFANTESLQDAEVTLMDVVPDSLPPMVEVGQHIAKSRQIGLSVETTTDLESALEGAEAVIVALTVGGFASMRHDLGIPARYGIRQPVGDSVGPGGISRALRSAPVVAGVARAMEKCCPDALMINVSNPLTALCRAASRESRVRVVGLCNELVGLKFSLSLLFDAPMHSVDPVAAGVNHLPLVTALRIGETDGFARLRELLDEPEAHADEPIWMAPVETMHWVKVSEGDEWTKADVMANNRIKLELFRQFGVLPGSSDTHVSEFFASFVTPASDFGRDWGVFHYGLRGHQRDKAADDRSVAEILANDEISPWPSGELAAELLDGMVTGKERHLPMNLPNRGQVENLPPDVVVECIGVTGPGGPRPRDVARVDSVLGEHLRRVVAAQELTVEAALTGDRTRVVEAMFSDPVAGQLPYEQLLTMTDELLAATSAWLPQFTPA